MHRYNVTMEIHTFLTDSEAESLNFEQSDLLVLEHTLPTCRISHHSSESSLLSSSSTANYVLSWHFKAAWYTQFTRLRAVYTPAAGNDWVAADPSGQVPVVHGSFHGPILRESLLGALLFMNHRMPAMIRNHRDRRWDRNLQTRSRLLYRQTVMIIGLGHIGQHCADMLMPLVHRVLGVCRTPSDQLSCEMYVVQELPELLPEADHVILLLPGGEDTQRFMNSERLALMKPGSFIYNFGRGNALLAEDLLPALTRLGGAFLDVTEQEPLPPESPLWQHPDVFITPHSSCMYEDYTGLYLDEVLSDLKLRIDTDS